jgi:hypothetical protein
MELWPPRVPHPSQDLSGEESPSTIRTNMDAGVTRQRRRFTIGNAEITCSWELDSLQFAVFTSFYANKINSGADWFLMPLDLGGGIQEHTVRIQGGQFSHSYQEWGGWLLTAKLDVEERLTYSPALLSFFLDQNLTQAEIDALVVQFGRLHQLVHTDYGEFIT